MTPGDTVKIIDDPMTYVFIKWVGNKAQLHIKGLDKVKIYVNMYRVRKISNA